MLSVRRLHAFGRRMIPATYGYLRGRFSRYTHEEIEEILLSEEPPCHYDSDAVFEKLQASYGRRPEYGYDPYSTWRRGAERVVTLLQAAALREPGHAFMEVGCGDGMTAYLLESYGHRAVLMDSEDWRDARAKELDLVIGDACERYALNSDSVECAYSFNTFEHLTVPERALTEMIRVCKSGGTIYLEFAPLYASPWGLHAYRTMRMPYPQFLFSHEFRTKWLDVLGIHDLGRKRSTLQSLNGWRPAQFRKLWERDDVEIISCAAARDMEHLDIVKRFPYAFRGRGLTFDDITTHGLRVRLKKK